MAKLTKKQRKLLREEANRLAARQSTKSFGAINPQSADHSADRPANGESSKSAAKKDKQEFFSTDAKHVVILFLDGIGIGVSGVLANMFFGMGHKILGLWFSYISTVMGILLFAFPTIWYWPRLKRAVRKVSIAIIALLTICFCVWTYQEWKPALEAKSPTFAIILRSKEVAMEKPVYFLMWNVGNRGTVLSPIHVVLLAQFTNLREHAITINSYQFEGRTTNGVWKIMPTINPMRIWKIILFIRGDRKQTPLMADYGTNVFPEVIDGKSFPPGGSIVGNVFLEAPKEGFDGTMRCRIVDSADRESVIMVGEVDRSKWLDAYLSGGLSENQWRAEDFIKTLPVVRFSEAFGVH